MKKLNFLTFLYGLMLVMFGTAFVSCTDDDDDTEAPFLTVEPSTLSFGSDGQPIEGSQSYFTIKTNRPWTIALSETDKTWITLSATEGEGEKQIEVSIPANTTNEATIDVQLSNKVGVYLKKSVTIKATGSDTPVGPTTTIFNETAGSADVSEKPYVSDYTGWETTGDGSSTVTFAGDNTSVRSSGIASSGYDGASGPNVIFFGTAPATFTVQKITLKSDQTKLKLTFGASRSSKDNATGAYDNNFDISKFNVELSSNGTDFVPLTYTKNDGDKAHPYWVLATANFTLKNAVSELYIKFTAAESSVFRLDDITLNTGVGGEEIDLAGGTPPQPTSAIFNETAGSENVSGKPYVSDYTGWKTTGDGSSTVSYAGNNTSVRSSGIASSGYDGASGPNVIFFGAAPATFTVQKITLTSDQTKLKLTFGASRSSKDNATGAYDNNFDISKFNVELSSNGTDFVPLTYTKNDGDATHPYWILATADFTLKNAANELYIRFTATEASVFRLDDITLTTGAGGQEIDLAGGTPQPATPTITKADPASLSFDAAGGTKVIQLTITDKESNTLSASGLDNSFTVDIDDATNKVTVTAPANTTTSAINQTLTLSLTNGNSISVPVTVASETSADVSKITLDFTDLSGYPSSFPAKKGTYEKAVYSFGGYDLTFEGSKKTGYYSNTYGGTTILIFGAKGAYIELPAVNGKKLVKVTATTGANASKAIAVAIVDTNNNIVAGGEEVVWSQEGGNLTYSYDLTGTSNDTKYRIAIPTIDKNAQLAELILEYK